MPNLKLYCNSYILPIFDFRCMLWGQCSAYNMNRLLKLQKRVARIILQADFMTLSKKMFQELGWLYFTQRVQYHICVMVFKSLNGQAPEYILSINEKLPLTRIHLTQEHIWIFLDRELPSVQLSFLWCTVL